MGNIIAQSRNYCALGAQHSVLGIRGAVPIIHSGSECVFRLHKGMSFCNGYQGMGYGGGSATPNDNIHRNHMIMGGEARLRELIEGTVKVMRAELYVVLSGCNVELAGDDTSAVVREYRSQGIPIVSADTAGFKGSVYLGHELVSKAIAEHCAIPGLPRRAGIVNLWVSTPYLDPFWSGTIEAIASMLGQIGLKVNLPYGLTSDIRAWRRLPEAEFNLLISPWSGLGTMEYLREKFDTPYLHYPLLPIGAVETRKFLETVADYAGLNRTNVETFISSEETRFYYYLDRASELFARFDSRMPTRFYTIADSMYTASITRFLHQDAGMIAGGAFLIDNPPNKLRASIERLFLDDFSEPFCPVAFMEPENVDIWMREKSDDGIPLVLGSVFDSPIADERAGYYLSIGAPAADRLVLDCHYAGFRGGLRLLEDIYGKVLGLTV
ncbi:nitrogenase component 1 [Paenibacillus durus]|uniref:Nitrogenase/oxidoreductase component 1 domain-containing protein n=1 Tax=Paenibacillus durus TaxID=44251 RepID=A0A089HKN6_PAEDU|nr:nitrogenase component 1 [Paenibacillus durus]AIQ12516.1 hypothetical protein PDUR_11850 [Paenibacillus durus]